MKKFILLIITFTIFFSTLNNSFATNQYSEWYIERLLDLNVWIEEYDLTLAHINQMYFDDYQTQALFDEYKNTTLKLNKEILKRYREWNFHYYQVNWIILNQKLFIFHINKLFYYISLKNEYPNEKQLDDFILKHYSTARTYYKRIQSLVYRKY